MTIEQLDETDRGILHCLQEDARNNSAADIADRVGVTANTVRNRIQRLEDAGIIETYAPVIDYEQAGYQLIVVMFCTAPIPERPALANEALELNGVVDVRELMTGKRNVVVTAVASEGENITSAANELTELGLTIENEELRKNSYLQPFSTFGSDDVIE